MGNWIEDFCVQNKYYPINTLSKDKLIGKLEACQRQLASIDTGLVCEKWHGDAFLRAKELKKWLTDQMSFLVCLIKTFPVE